MSLARHITLFVLFLTPLFVSGQTEAELKVKAEQLFSTGQYVEATPLYLHLLSLQPRDYDYNYRYGTCLLYNSYKKQDAIRYLSYAVKGPSIDPAAFYFMGRAYHLNYQFNDAIREYKNYEAKAGAKGTYINEARRNVEMCANGKKLLSTLTEIVVSRKTEIKQEDFFRIYNLSNIGGSIIVGQDFQSKNDKKKGHLPLIHFPAGAQKVFFSSYGDGDQLDLYVVRRLPDGKFGTPQKLAGTVNTAYDEDFPYMHPDGKYLYFSSKGHNSMGGYDVFRAVFDEASNSFGQVENIDFAISSPDDDMFYMVDKDDRNAYFASTRQSQDGKIFVYEVLVDRVPIQLAVVKGDFLSEVNAQNKKMTVKIKEVVSGKDIGQFNTSVDGGYLITFPKGGKYEYSIQVEGSSQTFVSTVEIPYLKEFKPLKQKMVHTSVNGKEEVRIVNQFNEDVEDAQAIIAQVLKERSDLNVNVGEFDLNQLKNQQDEQQIIAELGLGSMSMREVAEVLKRKSAELDKPVTSSAAVENAVNAKVVELYSEVAAIDKSVKEMVQEADQTESEVVSYSLLTDAREALQNRNRKLDQIAELQQLGKQVGGTSSDPAEKEAFQQVARQVTDLMAQGNEDAALDVLRENSELVKGVTSRKATTLTGDLGKQQQELDKELQALNRSEESYTTQIRDLEAEIRSLEEKKGNVKEKYRAEIQEEIDGYQASVNELSNAREQIRKKQQEKSDERKEISVRLEVLSGLEQHDGSTVTNQQVAQAKKSVNSENARTLEQYINSQLAELNKKHPELASGNHSSSNADRIIGMHNSATEERLNQGDSASRKALQDLRTLNNQTLSELEAEQRRLNVALELDPSNESLKRQRDKLAGFAKKLEEENQGLDQQIAQATEDPVVTYTAKDLQDDIYPEYAQNMAEIRNNGALSRVERLEKMTREEETYHQCLSLILEETAAISEGDGADPSLKQKRDVLQGMLDELGNDLKRHRQELNKLQETEVANANSGQGGAFREVLNVLEEAHETQVNMLNEQDMSEADRLETLEKINAGYQNELKKQEATIREAQRQNPEDASLKDVLKEVQVSEQEVQTELDQIHTDRTQLEQGGTPDKLSFLTSLDKSFASDVAQMESGTASDKYQALIDREARYQQSLEQRLSENQSNQNPADAARIQEENQWINEALQESIGRAMNYAAQKETQPTTTGLSEQERQQVLAEVRGSSANQLETYLQATPTTLDEWKIQQAALETYNEQLDDRMEELERGNDPSKEAKIAVLDQEQQQVARQLRKGSVAIGELEQAALTGIPSWTNAEREAYVEEQRGTFAAAMESPTKGASANELRSQDEQLSDYQSVLENRIEEKEQELESTNDPRTQEELNVLKEELVAVSEQRRKVSVSLGELEQNALASKDKMNNKEREAYKQETRGSYASVLTTDVERVQRTGELEQQDQRLENYENELEAQLRDKRAALQEVDNAHTRSEVEVLEDELLAVQEQRSRISVRIGDLEQQALHHGDPTVDPGQQTPRNREQELQAQLSDENLSTAQRKEVQQELNEVRSARIAEENPVLEQQTANTAQQLEDWNQQLKTKGVGSDVQSYFDREQQQLKGLEQQLAKEKNEEQRNYLLKEIDQQQGEMATQIQEALLLQREEEVRETYGVETLHSEAQLENRQRSVGVEIGSVSQEINRLNAQLETAKAKERSAIQQEINQLEERRAWLQNEQNTIEQELALQPEVQPADRSAMQTTVSYNEERRIAATEAYETYAGAMDDYAHAVHEREQKSTQLEKEQEHLQSLIREEVQEGTDQTEAIEKTADRIRRYSVEIGELDQQIRQKKSLADASLPQNEEERMKFQNLALRGVNPLKKAVIAMALVPLPSAGIEINETGNSNYSVTNPIPVGVEQPSGLVYRVQVGAFAKPIPQDLFKEFTPVSGELIPNTNITRYMAGFFNNSNKVVEVREQIRALGYKDAFVVAYCDGERISFGEARRMEASGECVPQGTNELLLEVATRTVQTMGLEDTTKTLKQVPEYTYNQAPGAAPANAIEVYQGLFFTVQIGVYNTPVSHDRLLNLEPLLTLRLDNGQIRYSCGMFESSQPARQLEAEIRKKGIVDAFVAAYYKGKRISWQYAEQLLKEEGNSVLAHLDRPDKKTEKVIPDVKQVAVFDQSPVNLVTAKQPTGGVQVVSKQNYTTYPRDVVNRYNNKGVFYFDEKDGKVKSVVYPSVDQLPRIQAFQEDIDTVYYTNAQLETLNGNVVLVQLGDQHLAGDFADWMLHLNYRRSWEVGKNGLELRIFDIRKEQLEQLQQEIRVFGLEGELVAAKKEE